MRKLLLSFGFLATVSFAFGQTHIFRDQDTLSVMHLQNAGDRLNCFYKTNDGNDRYSRYRMTTLDSSLQITDTASFKIRGLSKEIANGENELYSYYLFRTAVKGKKLLVILVYDKLERQFHNFVKTNEDFDKLVDNSVSLDECRMMIIPTSGSDAARLMMQPYKPENQVQKLTRNLDTRIAPLLSFSLKDGTLLSNIPENGIPFAREIANGKMFTITADKQRVLTFHSSDIATGVELKTVPLWPPGKRRTLSNFFIGDNYVFITGMEADLSDNAYKNSLFYMMSIDYSGTVAFDKVDNVDRLPESRLHILGSTRNAHGEILLIGDAYHRDNNLPERIAVRSVLGLFHPLTTAPVRVAIPRQYLIEAIVTVRIDSNGVVQAFHSFPVPPRHTFDRVYISGSDALLRSGDLVQRYNVNNDDQPPLPYMTGVDPQMFMMTWRGKFIGFKRLPKNLGGMLSVIHGN